MKTFWMSGTDENGFRGACIVEANDFISAVISANLHECNPGGQLYAVEIKPGAMVIPNEARNVLLTKEDCERMFGPLVNTEQANKLLNRKPN